MRWETDVGIEPTARFPSTALQAAPAPCGLSVTQRKPLASLPSSPSFVFSAASISSIFFRVLLLASCLEGPVRSPSPCPRFASSASCEVFLKRTRRIPAVNVAVPILPFLVRMLPRSFFIFSIRCRSVVSVLFVALLFEPFQLKSPGSSSHFEDPGLSCSENKNGILFSENPAVVSVYVCVLTSTTAEPPWRARRNRAPA